MPRKLIINWFICFLVLLNLGLLTFLIYPNFILPKTKYPELPELTGNEQFGELKEYFQKLAKTKGAVYAYEVLKRAPIKPGTDMHLMGHVVGEELYKQKGAEGIKYCTQDFRNACSHTIVVGLFSEKGANAIPEIIRACEKAPGGKGAYNMCFHGLGHGVLAYTGYDIPKTVGLCSKTKTGGRGVREFPECVGGAVMEIISGGDHDKALWTKQSQKYLGGEDPLFPCNSDMIPEEAKSMCYVYLTPHLFNFAGADLGRPQERDYKIAFTYCSELTGIHRQQCYGGFGKEFVVLAKSRDIRNIEQMSREELQTVNKWCNLADSEDGKDYCLSHALGSLYWGGENNYGAAIKFCEMNKDNKDNCFDNLIGMVNYYHSENAYMEKFCSDLPSEFQAKCIN